MRSAIALRSGWFVATVLLLAFGADLLFAQRPDASSPRVRRSARPVTNQYIVSIKPGASAEGVATDIVRRRGGRLRHTYRNALRGFAVDLPEAAAQALASDPRVAYVQEDGISEVSVESQPAPPWGLDRIDQRVEAPDGRYRHSADGTGVHVYVIDTGIQATHVDFEGRVVPGVSLAGDGEPSTRDCHGHGTHVAGTVGGARSGVAKNVTLHAVRTQRCDGYGSWSDVIAAIDWIIANHAKPAVINMSLGSAGTDWAVEDAVARATQAGILFVAAAGNANADACHSTPGSAASAFLVGSVGTADTRASYSNFGPCVDVFAPGDSVMSAASWNDGEFQWMSGTSMASPHVAGAAALYLQRNPLARPADVRRAISSGASRGVVRNAGDGSPNALLFSLHLGDVVPPTVSLLKPTAGTLVSGAVPVASDVRDDVEVAEVSFYAGDRLIGTDVSAPYAVTWNTGVLANGTYGVRADARDTAGNVASSIPSLVSVHNASTQTSNPWASHHVGTNTSGTSVYRDGVLTVSAAGTDVWGTADAFEFVSRPWSGDVDVVARVSDLTKPADATFSLAGLSLRVSTDAGAAHVSLIITSDGKVKLRRRSISGASTLSDGPAAGTAYAPRWLKLTRRANVFTGFYSADGVTWTVAAGPYTVALPASVRVGFLAARNGGTSLTTATFQNVRVGSLPIDWANADIGNTGRLGSAQWGQTVAVDAGGSDLWSTADAFHFAYRRWTGDGTFVTRVESLSKPSDSVFALAALMIRETLTPGSKHASVLLSSDGKAKFRRRVTAAGPTASDGPPAGSVSSPLWLKLTRQGSIFTAFISSDGLSWRAVHTSQSISMSGSVYVGVAGVANGGAGLARVTFSPMTATP